MLFQNFLILTIKVIKMSSLKNSLNNKDTVTKECGEYQPPEWVEMICDLKIGGGYSYTKIAYCVGISPSEVHRIGTGKSHQPRYLVAKALMKLYYKVFYSQKRLPIAAHYLKLKK